MQKYPKFPRPFHVSTLLTDNFSLVLKRRGNIEPLQSTFQYVCSGLGLAGNNRRIYGIEGKFELE